VLGFAPASAQQPPLIRVGLGPTEAVAGLLYAAKAGIYKRYGLNVDLQRLNNGGAIASAISGGSLELGQGTPLNVALAVNRGLPFTIIGAISHYNDDKPDTALLVAASSPIRAPKDFEGKTMGVVSLQDMNSVSTLAWLDARGVDRSGIKYLELPPSAMQAALEQGRIDFVTLYEPFYTTAMAGGKVRVMGYPYGAIAKHFAGSVLFGGTQWLADHRDAVDRFLRASQEGSLYIAAHENESAAIVAEFTGVDPALLANIKHIGRGIPLSAAELQPVLDAGAKYGVLPRPVQAAGMICACAMKQ
jgi:NitT/TauT family transport system substrate-binding protein